MKKQHVTDTSETEKKDQTSSGRSLQTEAESDGANLDASFQQTRTESSPENIFSILTSPELSHSVNTSQKADMIDQLHQTYGNTQIQQTIQAKLKIGQPNDKYEQEADRVADEVMRIPEPQIRQQVEKNEKKEFLQTKESPGPVSNVNQDIQTRINNALKGGGQTLSKSERDFFEPRFRVDFNEVKIHTDGKAAQSAQAVNAQAFTVGNHIYFNHGEYNPGSDKGKQLLAHELVHVLQQKENILSETGGKNASNSELYPIHQHRNHPIIQKADKHSIIDFKDVSISLDKYEKLGQDFMFEEHNWVTHNMTLFLKDILIFSSQTGENPFSNLESKYLEALGVTTLANIVSHTIIPFAEKAESWVRRTTILLPIKAGLYASIFWFFAETLLESLVAYYFNKAVKTIEATTKVVGSFITGEINPAFRETMMGFNNKVQSIRHLILFKEKKPGGPQEDLSKSSPSSPLSLEIDLQGSLTEDSLVALNNELKDVNSTLENTKIDEKDETLYVELALFAGIYTGKQKAKPYKEKEKRTEKSSMVKPRSEKLMQIEGLPTGKKEKLLVDKTIPFSLDIKARTREYEDRSIGKRTTIVLDRRGAVSVTCDADITFRDEIKKELDEEYKRTGQKPDIDIERLLQTAPKFYTIGLKSLDRTSIPGSNETHFTIGKKEFFIWYNIMPGKYYLNIYWLTGLSHPTFKLISSSANVKVLYWA